MKSIAVTPVYGAQMTTSQQDVLGPGYSAHTLALAGGDVATLVRHQAASNTRGALLYVHGFVDYFFQTHVAEHFAERGYDFYGIDLRRYGRSIRPGDVPWFTTDLAAYYEELDLALELIRADGHQRIIVMAHSTGGLIGPLWLHDRTDTDGIEALVLNSPWLDLQENRFTRTVGTWVIRAIGRMRPMAIIPQGLGSVYPQSVHKDAHGEWDFSTEWKPLTPQPVRFGFLGAVRRGHARLHKGLNVHAPVLVMHSDRSRLGMGEWSPGAMCADTVLDVEQMKHWASSIGPRVVTREIPGGMHDLFLSAEPVRNEAFAIMGDWLDTVVE
jgi:alpha-beta hydrolase superfamily lysophospholipase